MLHQTNLSQAAQPIPYNDGVMVDAITAELGKLPAAVRSATLDQIAGPNWSAVVANYKAADAALASLEANTAEDETNQVASAAHAALTAMLLTPAPNLAALGYKLNVYGKVDGYELIDADDIGKALAADSARLIPQPTTESDTDWAFWTDCLNDIKANHALKGLTDNLVDALANAETTATEKLIALPSRNAGDVIAKVRALSGLNTMVSVAELEPLMIELEAFTAFSVPSLLIENPALTSAFKAYMAGLTDLRDAPPQSDENKLFDALAPSEMAIRNEAACTPAGVAMKLKHALVGLAPEAWGTQALFDPTTPEFRDGVELADHYQQVLWLAIRDLDGIVSAGLREQAA